MPEYATIKRNKNGDLNVAFTNPFIGIELFELGADVVRHDALAASRQARPNEGDRIIPEQLTLLKTKGDILARLRCDLVRADEMLKRYYHDEETEDDEAAVEKLFNPKPCLNCGQPEEHHSIAGNCSGYSAPLFDKAFDKVKRCQA